MITNRNALTTLLSIAISVTLISCTNGKNEQHLSKQETNAINKLAWIMDFNVDREILSIQKTKDFRLYAKGYRQPVLFGMSSDENQALLKNCGFKYAEGYGDVIYGEAHKKLRNKAALKLSEYNQKLKPLCLSRLKRH